jgi:3-methyladenine DNA glycosylase/8-oxoguanine DNA glycosylase
MIGVDYGPMPAGRGQATRRITGMPGSRSWSEALVLQGPGGEPVDFARTVLSHGVADLPPNVVAPDGTRLETVLPAAGRAWLVRLVPGSAGVAEKSAAPGAALAPAPAPATAVLSVLPDGAPPPPAGQRVLAMQLRHMLRLDEDLSAFYAAAAGDPALAWVAGGAGRMLRSPTVFEDLVKTICTTNCAWSATVRMVTALVGELGMVAFGASGRRAFPTPEAMAGIDDAFYRDVARTGYRGPYLRTIATDVADGRLDLEALNDPALSDDHVALQLLALPGVGPYAAAHMMMLLGRYRRLILDSWTRPTYRRLSGRPRVTDKGIERAFRRYREFAGLAFWLTLTEGWLSEGPSAEPEGGV